jgi:acyl-CoA reductase-like NAD-dependent aldehyde dehydrogenase
VSRWRKSPWPTRPTSTEPSTQPAPRSTATGQHSADRALAPLHALADALVANRKELAELEVRNVGKALSSVKAELNQAVENFRFYASRSARSRPLEPARRLAPLLLAEGARRSSRADRALELPADDDDLEARAGSGRGLHDRPQADSQTPLTALRMAELATEVGFPPGSINVVPGPGETIGSYLVKHPGVDKIAFTGSTETGAQIMRDASDGIKRLTLELGGKSPNIVFADADLGRRDSQLAWSIYYSAARAARLARGSSSSSPATTTSSRSSVRGREQPQGRRPARGRDADRSLISPEHRERVHGYRRDRARGRRGGRRPAARQRTARARSTADRPRRVEPGDDRRQEEIFGPVVTISPFEDEKDAIRQANACATG